MLQVNELTLTYGKRQAVKDVSFEVRGGDFIAILGPNGSGKSTLLKALCRLHKPAAGSVCLDGRDISKVPHQELARRLALVRQESSITFDFTVEEVALLGRLPHLRRFQSESARDLEIVSRFLELTGIAHLKDRCMHQLSGGERQRVFVSQALIQEPSILFLDEPTNHLDINHQIELLDLIAELNRKQGLTVVAVLHDLNLAALYARRLLVLSEGQLMADGTADEIVQPELIKQVYGCQAIVVPHPQNGRPQVLLEPQHA